MSLPSNHTALVVVERGKVAIKQQALPECADDEVLVKVKAVAINPTDWKHIDWVLQPGQSVGCDFSGTICAMGKNAKNKGFSIGDPVAGITPGPAIKPNNGAFQEYVAAHTDNIWKKPDILPYESAAHMGGVSLSAAAFAIHCKLGIPLKGVTDRKPIIIWSGASGVGMAAIKIASLAGMRVITTAAEQNKALLQKLGAEAVIDYKDPEAVQKVKQWANNAGCGAIKLAFDCISEHDSTQKCCDIVGQGGKVIRLDTMTPSPNLDAKGAEVEQILLYTALDPKNVDHKALAEWNRMMPSLIESKKLTKDDVPLKLFHGFEELPEAIDYMRKGKAHGEKVVVVLQKN
ncbi:SubName: Full=Related to toxD protein {ECO:0000313/EMBL:CCA74644.1} [Serendipita indica DSM 11827]|nr:SubName: Full=Related to toxD protein {ECO:0000313/EMBL:CCA74644.1} [Serendipita indica DSM 11827]